MRTQELFARDSAVPADARYLRGASWTAGFGHIALLDFFAKLRLLDLSDQEHVVLAPPSTVANPAYLECWRPWLRIETDATQILDHDTRLREDYPAVLKVRGGWYWLHDAMAIVEQRWQASRGGPLISAPDHVVERGRRMLEQWKVPSSAWFVTIHVREQGLASGGKAEDSVRNANIATYFDAIRLITSVGGWVFRLGHPGMTPLPKMPQVIDYAHHRAQVDWLDVFLIARARFVIATNSGPAWVAGTFGTPALLTNWGPPGIRTHYRNTMTLPQTLWSSKDKRPLTEREAQAEPWAFLESARMLERHGLISVRNSAHEIADHVRAMLERY